MHFPTWIVLSICVLFVACEGPKEPEIRRLENVRTTKVSTDEVVIAADLVGFNPNPVGGTVAGTDLVVTVNGVETAAVIQDEDAAVGANQEFTLPISCSVSPSRLFNENRGGVLGGVLNAVLNRKVDVHFGGTVSIKVAGFTFDQAIDHDQEIQIK